MNPYLYIESLPYRKGDPVPHIDFHDVFHLFKVDPSDPLVNIQEQIRTSPGDYLKIFFYTVRWGK